ncbi:hypothetical protein PR048_012012 [Dryococelus australis]|uniref:Uncharacterized protein n=1 Tax=Dryococelus australis TaxID=614101 RepID=A0ABQ9HN50_9NEOP|nr:hypothetical protein PR048_012012 [Dryococelus australis]
MWIPTSTSVELFQATGNVPDARPCYPEDTTYQYLMPVKKSAHRRQGYWSQCVVEHIRLTFNLLGQRLVREVALVARRDIEFCGERATVAERLACSPPAKAIRIQSLVGFSHVGIMPDDDVGRRIFSGISRFPRPFIPALLHTLSHRLSRPRITYYVWSHVVMVSTLDSEPSIPSTCLTGTCPAQLDEEHCTIARAGDEHLYAKMRLGKGKEAAGIAERRMEGARVCEAERVASSSHQTALGRARSAARLSSRTGHTCRLSQLDVRTWKCGGCCHWTTGYLGLLPFPQPQPSAVAPSSLHFILTSPQFLAVKAAVVERLDCSPSTKISQVGIVPDDSAGWRVLPGIFLFPRPYIPTRLHSHLISLSLSLNTSGARMKGRGKRDIPEKTRRPTSSSGTTSTCESPVTRPEIEPSSPWWETSVPIAQPPWPQHVQGLADCSWRIVRGRGRQYIRMGQWRLGAPSCSKCRRPCPINARLEDHHSRGPVVIAITVRQSETAADEYVSQRLRARMSEFCEERGILLVDGCCVWQRSGFFRTFLTGEIGYFWRNGTALRDLKGWEQTTPSRRASIGAESTPRPMGMASVELGGRGLPREARMRPAPRNMSATENFALAVRCTHIVSFRHT